MILLALDQASKVSGWAIFIDGELKHYGKIVADHADFGDKLVYIRKEIIKLINDYEVDEVVFEDIQLQENVNTFKALAEVFGVVDELCAEFKVPRTSILASVWKSKLGIKGKDRPAQKRAAQNWVVNTYNIKVIQDIADAVCIGTAYLKDIKKDVYDWS